MDGRIACVTTRGPPHDQIVEPRSTGTAQSPWKAPFQSIRHRYLATGPCVLPRTLARHRRHPARRTHSPTYVHVSLHPSLYLDIEVVGLVGYRVEFADEDMLTCSFMYPRGLDVGYRGISAAIGRPTVTQDCPGRVFELCGVAPDTRALETLHLYALLRKSGPVAIELHPKLAAAADYSVLWQGATAAASPGTLRVELVDAAGREVRCPLRWQMKAGKAMHTMGPSVRDGSCDPRDLQWEGDLVAFADGDLPPATYRIYSCDTFLGPVVTSMEVRVESGVRRVVRQALQVGIGRFELGFGGKGCNVVLQAEIGTHPYSMIRRFRDDDVMSLLLPSGAYAARIQKPGCLEQEIRFAMDGRDAKVVVEPWVRTRR